MTSRKRRRSTAKATTAPSPTSRANFRLLAKGIGATNREADSLRHVLLANWGERGTTDGLLGQLGMVDPLELQESVALGYWLSFDTPDQVRSVLDSDPLLAELSGDVRGALTSLLDDTGGTDQ